MLMISRGTAVFKGLGIAALVFGLLVAGQAEASSAMPKAYHGKWAPDKLACVDPEMTSGVLISAHRLTFYELVVRVRKVEKGRPNEIMVSGWFDDAGSAGPGTIRMVMGDGGRTLTFRGDLTENYIRCR